MKGLLLKDVLNLKQQGGIYLLMIVFWGIISFVNKDVSFFMGIICMFACMQPISALAYDEKEKWDKYGLSMPISKADMVISKYILGVGLLSIAFLLSFLFEIILQDFHMKEITNSFIMFSIFIIVISVMLPVLFKYGVEKGRMTILLIVLIPTLLTSIMQKAGISMPSEFMIEKTLHFLPIISLFLFIASIVISIHIYTKKEL